MRITKEGKVGYEILRRIYIGIDKANHFLEIRLFDDSTEYSGSEINWE